MILIILFHYKYIDKWAPVIYVLNIVLLFSVHLFGKHIAGSTRWLAIGPFTLQPSEFAKLAVIFILSKLFAKNVSTTGLTPRRLLAPMILTAIPFFLVATQPDLGTAGTIILIATSMTFFTKIERKTLICLLVTVILVLPIGWHFLQPYQIERIMTLLSPDRDPLGAGYHLRQSKIAIGSGLMFGKGYMQGTQKMLSFLPEQHTDFIFSVIAEEWGFAGSMLMLFLFLLLISFGLNIAHGCKGLFWDHFVGRDYINDILASIYQHCDDYGVGSGCGNALTADQLWRFIGYHNAMRNRNINEYQHAKIYERIIISQAIFRKLIADIYIIDSET